MQRNQWEHLLARPASLNTEQRDAAASAIDNELRTLAWGMSAIGSLVAGAALNEKAGIDAGKLADLGWLLQSMGDLSVALIDTAEGIHYEARGAAQQAVEDLDAALSAATAPSEHAMRGMTQ